MTAHALIEQDRADEQEHLIEESAAYWHYDADDLRLIRETAHRDPEGTRRSLLADPPRPFMTPNPNQGEHQHDQNNTV